MLVPTYRPTSITASSRSDPIIEATGRDDVVYINHRSISTTASLRLGPDYSLGSPFGSKGATVDIGLQ